MTMLQSKKKCPTCKKSYSWNPDVGQGLFCPYCTALGVPPQSTMEDILRKNRKKNGGLDKF